MKEFPQVFISQVNFDKEGKRQAYHWTGNPERARRFAGTGIVTPTDISAVEAVVIMEEVLGIARPLYSLRQACRVVGMDTLTHNVDVYTKLSADEKVPPMVESEIKQQDRARVPFDLWKNVVHVAVADEAEKKSAHNEMILSTEDAAGALANSENSQIATEFETATGISGADWGTITDGRSANNPYEDIMKCLAVVEGTGGHRPDFVLAHPYTWIDFFGNDFVKGQLKGLVYPGTKVFDLPGMPGMKGLSDWALTNTIAIVLDSRQAVILGDGPMAAEKYRKATAGYDAYIVRQWLQPLLVQANAIRKLTGVHA